MNLADTVALISAGGPGSGCHGDNCGRPSTGGSTDKRDAPSGWYSVKPPTQKEHTTQGHKDYAEQWSKIADTLSSKHPDYQRAQAKAYLAWHEASKTALANMKALQRMKVLRPGKQREIKQLNKLAVMYDNAAKEHQLRLS